MDWHDAYLAQARSEFAILRRFQTANVAYCHRLHYLQMVTEKLAKGLLTPPRSKEPAPPTHVMFVRMLQVVKGRPEVRSHLGYRSAAAFAQYINSLLDLARKIEMLSPDQAGFSRPNPEYPWWRDLDTRQAWAPVEYDFSDLNPLDPRMLKVDRLIADLLRFPN